MKGDLLSPREAASVMGISQGTITRCVKLGAPVHRWGSTGYRYRIDVNEFVAWMEKQGQKKEHIQRKATNDVEEMARRRREMINAIR